MPQSPSALSRAAFAIALASVLASATLAAAARRPQGPSGQTTGPDVTVISFSGSGLGNYGASAGVHAYSIGTTSCNVGNVPVWWCDSNTSYCSDEQHPVIAQNLFRLKSGRFEQIGMSWLKHGFVSTNSASATCLPGVGCQQPQRGGDQLGIGCTDTYGSSLNGSRPLGMRSEVNPTTGVFPFPYTAVGSSTVIDQRIQVEETDLDPALNPGALYYAEGQYIAADDARAGNGLNNASYRQVLVGPAPTFELTFTSSMVREKSALEAWPVVDPSVALLNVDYTSKIVQRFHVARKVTETSPGIWHYEIAVHNLNSERAAWGLSIDFPDGAQVTNVGFRDVDHHSGEPYATTDWTVATDAGLGRVSWTSQDWDTDQNANALRWGTMFSFWFDVDSSAQPFAALGLFRPDPARDAPALYFYLPPVPALAPREALADVGR
jgi:hypothetical protein